ncbi:MAG: DNA mismatch repair protein MutT [Pseudomonadota bacterium]
MILAPLTLRSGAGARAAAPETGGPRSEANPSVRDAASLILLRADPEPRVLMGLRGAAAAFMPNKFVFPGGAVDADDAAAPSARRLDAACAARLAKESPADRPAAAFAHAALRETFEETGLRLAARPDPEPAAADADGLGDSWRSFCADGLGPNAGALRFVFRAITPPGPPRRFDARFFLASAAAVIGDPDDFSAASGELSHLTWAPLADARALDLPFITAVVLAEIQSLLDGGWRPDQGPPPDRPVPFFRHAGGGSEFVAL